MSEEKDKGLRVVCFECGAIIAWAIDWKTLRKLPDNEIGCCSSLPKKLKKKTK